MAHLFNRFISSKTIGLLVKLGLTCLAFWLVLHNLDFGQLSAIVHQQDHGLLLAASGLILIQIILGALRWRLVLLALAGGANKVIGLWEALRLYYISVFFNCCLPGTVGGDVVRVWLAKSDHIPLPLSINAVIIDRIVALIALGLLVLAAFPILGGLLGLNLWLAFLLLGAAILGVWSLKHLHRWLLPWRENKLIHAVLYFIECLKLLTQYPKATLFSLVYALFAHVAFCACAYVLAQSLGIAISFLHCLAIVPLVLLATTIPISIGGWGVREASMVGMLGLIGIDKALALVLSVQLGLVTILVSLPGGVLWLLHRRGKRYKPLA